MIMVMKKASGFIGGLTLLFLAIVPLAQAASHIPTPVPTGNVLTCPPGQFNALCNLTSGNFGATLGSLITLAFVAAIVVALVFLIWGGIKWIMSGGDKTALEEARNHVVAAIVGLVIVFLVFFVLNLLVFFFTGQPIFNLKLPTLSNVTPNPT